MLFRSPRFAAAADVRPAGEAGGPSARVAGASPEGRNDGRAGAKPRRPAGRRCSSDASAELGPGAQPKGGWEGSRILPEMVAAEDYELE